MMKHVEQITNLTDIANYFGCDKGTEAHEKHGYTNIYNELICQKSNMLEIGIDTGLSIQMWKRWSPDINIIAIDNRSECITQIVNDLCDARMCDQSNCNDLTILAESIGYGKLDIIIDDGSHIPNDQLLSINVLFSCLKSGGKYFVEDLHTSNWFPIEERAPDRLIKFAKSVNSDISFFCNKKLAMIVRNNDSYLY